MADDYGIPSGPTASYQGDPNDYSGGSSWWDSNGGAVINSFTDTLGDLLNFGGNIYAINNRATPAQTGYYPPYAPQGTQPLQQNNTGLYIGGAVILIVLILVIVFALKK